MEYSPTHLRRTVLEIKKKVRMSLFFKMNEFRNKNENNIDFKDDFI